MICPESSRFCPIPSMGSNLPLYIEVGQVHGDLGSLVYGLRAGVQEDITVARMDLGVVVEPEKP
jgi:hypothetical protein